MFNLKRAHKKRRPENGVFEDHIRRVSPTTIARLEVGPG